MQYSKDVGFFLSLINGKIFSLRSSTITRACPPNSVPGKKRDLSVTPGFFKEHFILLCLNQNIYFVVREPTWKYKAFLHAKYTFLRSNLFLTSQKETNTQRLVFTSILPINALLKNISWIAGLAEPVTCFFSQ